MSFENKFVLITGASSGIGAAAAVEFTKEGAKVAIVGRNQEKLENVAKECEKNGQKPLVIKADISNDDEAKKIVDTVIQEFKRLDVLVNNAGISRHGTILDETILAGYDVTMKVNVRAHINITTLAVPHLIKTKGNIVNISSVTASTVPSQISRMPYFVSKAALNHFSRCAALELASVGVRVNIVSPGYTRTDLLENAGLTGITYEDLAAHTPFKRVSEPKEIADLILYLASDKAIGITGSEFVADNGYLLK